jgi:hypothetical protein
VTDNERYILPVYSSHYQLKFRIIQFYYFQNEAVSAETQFSEGTTSKLVCPQLSLDSAS